MGHKRPSAIAIAALYGIGFISILALMLLAARGHRLIAVLSPAHAEANESPQAFFEYAVGDHVYPLSYLAELNVRHHYDTIAIFNQPNAGPPAFELRDTKPIAQKEGPVFSFTRYLKSGSINSTTYQGCWIFSNRRGLREGPWDSVTGYALTFYEIYDGTICAENRDIVLAFDIFSVSGSSIAAVSKQTGSCGTPTPEYLARFGITDRTEKSIFNPNKVECVYLPEHHKVKFSS